VSECVTPQSRYQDASFLEADDLIGLGQKLTRVRREDHDPVAAKLSNELRGEKNARAIEIRVGLVQDVERGVAT
jgi:hypothetical protein